MEYWREVYTALRGYIEHFREGIYRQFQVGIHSFQLTYTQFLEVYSASRGYIDNFMEVYIAFRVHIDNFRRSTNWF